MRRAIDQTREESAELAGLPCLAGENVPIEPAVRRGVRLHAACALKGFWPQPFEGRRNLHCLVVYDITDDRIRAKVADICLDYGLTRIQYSAFLGSLSANHQQELLLKVRRRLGRSDGNVQLFPLCERDLRLRKAVGNPPPETRG